MSWLFLAVSVVGALFTLNAFRPSNRWQLVGFSFFAAWLTGELVVWHLVWQATATVVFVLLGALDAWPGWLGLAITLASWAGLVVLATVSRRSAAVFEEAVDRALALEPGGGLRIPWRQSALPFYLRDHRVERIKDLAYGPFGKRNRLDVWRPRAAAEDGVLRPVLLQIHGGAWVIGDKGQQGLPLMMQLAAEGWVCVAINYRLSPRATWPDQLVDAKLALAWVREHITEHGGDPARVHVTGGSAGGHIAAMVALTANDPRYQPGFEQADTSVRSCVPMYGVYDLVSVFDADAGAARAATLLGRWVMKTTITQDRAAYEDASPITHVRPDAPPFFVVHGTADNLAPVGQARAFVARLRAESGSPVAYAEVPRASHAFDVFHSTRTAHAVHAVQRFLAWAESAPLRSAAGR